jgi:hypothetical protein
MKGIGVGRKYMQIFSFSSISEFLVVILTAGTLLTGSCTKINEFTIGKDFVESQTKLQIIDTFKVDLSTVLLDSIATSSSKIAFVGGFKDDTFGSVKCESYFDLAYESFSDIDSRAIFDSAAFVLHYSGYSYGDTTSLMTISIHKLTEKITPFDNGYLYNNSSFDYEPDATGTLTFYPESTSSDTTISIPVNKLGEELFSLILNKDEKVSSAEWFSDYLKGFVLTSGMVENKAVIVFTADQTNTVLKLYYHLDLEQPEKKEITITMGEANHQFNHIVNDLTGTPIYRIKQEGNEISSVEADNRGYLQGLTGFLPKIQFPTLGNTLMLERWKILKAELIIKPAKGTYDLFRLPKSLHIYDTDRENRIKTELTNSNGDPLVATFEFDEFYDETTSYTFDITAFINNELFDAIFDYEHGLLIGLEQDKFRTSLDRLVIEGKKPPVKLRIYYLSY